MHLNEYYNKSNRSSFREPQRKASFISFLLASEPIFLHLPYLHTAKYLVVPYGVVLGTCSLGFNYDHLNHIHSYSIVPISWSSYNPKFFA